MMDGKRFKNIEKEFFEIDEESKIAYMHLSFSSPKELFDSNALTKKPMLNDEFMDWLKTSFEYAPRRCKIELTISFNEMDGYSEDSLQDIFMDNLMLEGKKNLNVTIRKNKIAFGLVGLGLFLLVGMIIMLSLWKEGGVAKEIISYVLDIAATVTFWEALNILIVENKEKRDIRKSLSKKFSKVSFVKKGNK